MRWMNRPSPLGKFDEQSKADEERPVVLWKLQGEIREHPPQDFWLGLVIEGG